MRIGQGYDIHRFGPPSAPSTIAIGGLKIPFDRPLIAHSDGDVVLHALCDALLGALALGDIGSHFPDTSAQNKGLSSDFFLKEVVKMVSERGYFVQNVDVSVILEKPKLRPYIDDMRTIIARVLEINVEQVSIKAKTNEGLDAVGKMDAIAAQAVALLLPIPN